MTSTPHFSLASLLAAMAAIITPMAVAQTVPVPDAGRIQREAQPPVLRSPQPTLEIRLDPGAAERTAPGGPKVQVTRVEFSGNTLVTTDTLQKSLADQMGQTFDLAGLRGLAQRISAVYQAAGYPFARAFVLPQTVQDGVVKLGILEGRYGQVKVEGDPGFAADAPGFLAPLKPGEVIESSLLTRTLLILGDQPGVKVIPLVRAGRETGTGDLVVTVERLPLTRFEVGYDNHGSRFTGSNRLRLNAQFDSPFMLGDQIAARAVYSDGDLWLGSFTYGLPLGSTGLRASANTSRTSYSLGKDFATLGASGTADSTSLTLSYPLLRLTSSNATLSATLQRKDLRDQQRALQSEERKSSQSLPLALQFDRRDEQGLGITYGSLTWTRGDLNLQGQALLTDTSSGRRSDGSFSKWNLDLARVQPLPVAGLSFSARVSAQQANKNLDSSEKFALGGPNGVRAFPLGEGNADSGALMQLELRSSMGAYAPYAFFDAGRATLNARSGQFVVPVSDNSRSIAGAGLGLRFNQGPWSVDGMVARQTSGGPVLSEKNADKSRAWLTVGYRF